MSTQNESLFEKSIDPVLQAAVALGGVLAFIVVAKFIDLIGLMEIPERFPWMTAAAFLLLFALFNSVFSLSSENMLKYWGRSVYSFLGLAAAAGGLAYLFSSLSIGQAGSYKWIYVVVSIGYLVFLSMMATMRKVVEFAQKEEWNHPRIRKRKSKK